MLGWAALIKEGLFPFLVEAWSVNWLTTRISPDVSRMLRFILPSSSPKMRRREILEVSHSMSELSSDASMPSKIRKPWLIEETIFASMDTDAEETRCSKALMGKNCVINSGSQ